MTEKLYLITEAQRQQLCELIEKDGFSNKPATDMLQSLPMVSGEPVAWLITTELQDGTRRTYAATGKYSHVKDACDFGNPVPLYTHAQPLQPITADEITPEIVAAYGANFNSWDTPSYAEQIEAAYNAVIKHRSEAK